MSETRISQVENLEIFLLNLRYKEGTLIEVEGNRPILLDDPASVWIVYAGSVDVFSVPVQLGEAVGARRHLFRSTVGQVLFGIDSTSYGKGFGFLASGTPGTRLLKLRRARLWELAGELENRDLINAMLEDWITGLSLGLSKEVTPKEYVLLEASQSITVEEHQVAVPKKDVLWIRCEAGHVQLMGSAHLIWNNVDGFLPASPHTWLRPVGSVKLSMIDTEAFTRQDIGWSALEHFHRMVIEAVSLSRTQEATIELKRLQDKAVSERFVMENALFRLSTPLAQESTSAFTHLGEDGQDPLLAACRLVGHELGIEIQPHPRAGRKASPEYRLKTMAQASRIQIREVALRGEWWRSDNGPLLGFLADSQQAVALLPSTAHRYALVDPIERTRTRVTPQLAARLSPIAYTLYRPLPNRVLWARDLLRLGLSGSRHDVRSLILIGLGISLLGLLPPVATGAIVNTIIPQGDTGTLLQLGLGLLLVAVSVGLLQLVRGISVLRVQSKIDASVQAAVWDRLLNLPIPFFANFTAGDLGSRAMGISEMRRMLSGYTVATVLNGLFSFFNLALLFFYSVKLALVALAIALVALLVTVVVGVRYVRARRALEAIRGKVSGTTLQLLTGVTKFRVAGAEHHAFATWSNGFSTQKRLYYKARRVTDQLTAYNAAYPVFASLIIFALVASAGRADLSTGNFLAFNLAFVQFLSSWFLLGSILVNVLNVVPIYEQLKPILVTKPEVDDDKIDPGELAGRIEVNHVSFRYKDKTSLVLKDISLEAKPGEFVALVGPSGSGKSSLLRLLLGFATPESGGIYYDNQDLADLDLHEVRRQIGVVLQSATLMAGDIFTNITSSWPNLTIDDAWEAARMSGLAEDIVKLPMGMHTVVSERGGNFSGGQRQRLLIARAIVNRPRLLFFDEATSALDNQTQAIVSRSLEGLRATRLVIAHRLSTIINADRIYVFDSGSIAQVGTYRELIKRPGPFADLARRQTL